MRPATVFAPCLHGDRPRATGASHNALARGLCDDQGVRPTVLIVDDHDDFRASTSALLEAEGFAALISWAPMRLFRFALWPPGAALGILAEQIYFGWGDARHWVPDLVTGWSLIACGLVGWSRRSESRSGALMAATGFAWFA